MGWGQIDWYFHTDNLIFLRKGSAWLAIPKRIFSDEGQLREFMKMLDYRIPLDEQSIS
jgi:hypothetical protein